MASKSPEAFRTIGEVAADLGVAQHILRYWETKFPQLRPLQRAGNRRYYRPADVAIARTIHRLLDQEGYTVRGVRKVLAEGSPGEASVAPEVSPPSPAVALAVTTVSVEDLRALRERLAAALDA